MVGRVQCDRKALAQWRLDRGFTQKGMADLVGCHVNTVIAWEKDGKVHPRFFRRLESMNEDYAPWVCDPLSPFREPAAKNTPLDKAQLAPADLRRWRESWRLSVPDLAKRIGCLPCEVEQWETIGMVSPRHLDIMRLIDGEETFAKSLKEPPDFLK